MKIIRKELLRKEKTKNLEQLKKIEILEAEIGKYSIQKMNGKFFKIKINYYLFLKKF